MKSVASCWLLLAVGVVVAQQPVPPPAVVAPAPEKAPAIVLLLREPRPLAEDRVRRRLSRLLDAPVGDAKSVHGTWLVADGSGLVGARSGQRFTVRIAPAEALSAAATSHLADDARESLPTHRARFVVAGEPGKDAAATHAAYRRLGAVAAALLQPDVLAVGAAEYGTFEPYELHDRDLEADLLGEDPLLALAPMLTTSLVVFLREPRVFEEAALGVAAGREFGVVFAPRGRGAAASNFVGVDEQLAMLCVDHQSVVLTVGLPQHPDAEALRAIEDLRVRKVLGEHRAVLEITARGALGEAEEARRARLVARTLAAVWGDDVLGCAWGAERTVLAATDDLRERLRAADPVAATLGPAAAPRPPKVGK